MTKNVQEFASVVVTEEDADLQAIADMVVPDVVLQRAKGSNKVVDWVLNTSPSTLTQTALDLFPGKENTNSRMLFYTWAVTVVNRHNPRRNPKVIPINLIGAAGYGKSALTYDFGNVMSKFLTEKFGTEIKFHIMVKTLAGILDLTDIVGISTVQNGVTKIAPPDGFPMDDSSVGIMFLD